eukprot:m.166252 g.166252  ORF g.166252 m.166252 type:complete len:150 (-) comp15239_c5_seq7:221-670(-)
MKLAGNATIATKAQQSQCRVDLERVGQRHGPHGVDVVGAKIQLSQRRVDLERVGQRHGPRGADVVTAETQLLQHGVSLESLCQLARPFIADPFLNQTASCEHSKPDFPPSPINSFLQFHPHLSSVSVDLLRRARSIHLRVSASIFENCF